MPILTYDIEATTLYKVDKNAIKYAEVKFPSSTMGYYRT